MHIELLLLGLVSGGIVGGAGLSGFYHRKLHKHARKHAYQLNTIEQLYKELQVSSRQVDRNYLETIESLVMALEARDMYTKGHSERVNKMSMAIAHQLGLSNEEKEILHHGSLLHDIGKIGIYDRVLLKPQALNEEEFQIMKSHPEYGVEILKGSSFFQKHIPIILHHHERMDGKGYPLGLKGDEIPLGARICQVADAWDAMASDRPYRRRLDEEEAKKRLKEAAGSQLDPICVEAFLDWKAQTLSSS
ncbi:MAG: HD domain-containing protein [Bradymonadales bacterium]|nr:MAG: HD domain-containing protein [Bradymonadales bacterium]